jgi:hypothetical protein
MNFTNTPSALTNRAIILTVLLLVSLATVSAQSPAGSPAPSPSPSEKRPSLEHEFFKNILKDQGAIWSSPIHLRKADAQWAIPLGLSTAALIATDNRTAGEIGEFHDQIQLSHNISYLGSSYGTGAIAAAFYVIGRTKGNYRARETGILGAEAVIDSGLVYNAVKVVVERRRPLSVVRPGDFFERGTSFPSGHSAAAWSLATVVANEYHDRRAVQITAYALATAVSISRFTGRNHFLSDVLIGSAIGYGIGHYVYHKHHVENSASSQTVTSKLWPQIAPAFDRRQHRYGVGLSWDF